METNDANVAMHARLSSDRASVGDEVAFELALTRSGVLTAVTTIVVKTDADGKPSAERVPIAVASFLADLEALCSEHFSDSMPSIDVINSLRLAPASMTSGSAFAAALLGQAGSGSQTQLAPRFASPAAPGRLPRAAVSAGGGSRSRGLSKELVLLPVSPNLLAALQQHRPVSRGPDTTA